MHFQAEDAVILNGMTLESRQVFFPNTRRLDECIGEALP
jgi:hypothetical protein